jgi:signal peptidase II
VSPRIRAFLVTSLPVLLADAATKALAVRLLRPAHVPHDVLGSWLRLTLGFNRQGALGLTLGAWSRPVLAGGAVVALGAVAVLLRRGDANDRPRAVALRLLAAGAAGNLWDRLRWGGGVVDFLDVGVGSTRFWTFNLADAALTAGALLLGLLVWRDRPRDDPAGRAGAAKSS